MDKKLVERFFSAPTDGSFFLFGPRGTGKSTAGSEVDFVLYGESGIFAFEVKNTNVVRRSDLRHLRTFLADYPMATGFFLYRGEQTLLIDGIQCRPCGEFLSLIDPDTDFRTIFD